MRLPRDMSVIQIDVTNRCDGPACSNCTRMLPCNRTRFAMSLENFEQSVQSLADFPGIVGVFGGNPCIHPDFPEICNILWSSGRAQAQCGLWTNHFNGHGEIIRETFGYYNLNVHGNTAHAEEMREALGDTIVPMPDPGPDGQVPRPPKDKFYIFGEHRPSYHCPPMLAIRDMIEDEAEQWKLIERCPVNRRWSACITEIDGTAYAYFCEIAAAFEQVYGVQTGLNLLSFSPGREWWRWDWALFKPQADFWCPQCGMALPMEPRPDSDQIDDVSEQHYGYPCWALPRQALWKPEAYERVMHELRKVDRTLDYQQLRHEEEPHP